MYIWNITAVQMITIIHDLYTHTHTHTHTRTRTNIIYTHTYTCTYIEPHVYIWVYLNNFALPAKAKDVFLHHRLIV